MTTPQGLATSRSLEGGRPLPPLRCPPPEFHDLAQLFEHGRWFMSEIQASTQCSLVDRGQRQVSWTFAAPGHQYEHTAQMEQVPVDDLLSNSIITRPDHLDPKKVERYMIDLDQLPAVVAFRTPRGLLLADGYHRATAASRLGRRTILADVRVGTPRDALMHAAEVGAAETGLSKEDVLQRILRPGR